MVKDGCVCFYLHVTKLTAVGLTEGDLTMQVLELSEGPFWANEADDELSEEHSDGVPSETVSA